LAKTQLPHFSPASPRLSLFGASALGVASMLGAGVFVVFAPAAELAGSYLFLAIAIAGVVASLNARSMRQLSKVFPRAGGAYAFGKEYLSSAWGFLAGIAFILGKVGSVAAIALVAASYIYPEAKVEVAFASLALMTGINLLGINRTATGALLLSVPTVALLLLVGISGFQVAEVESQGQSSIEGVLPAAALIFFAFAGYARVATLGPEVKNPSENIPKAITLSLVFVIAIYFLVANALQAQLGKALQFSIAPIQDFAAIALPWLPAQLVVVVAATACLGSLLSLLAGISRTAEAMAKDREIPRFIGLRSKRFDSPWVADLLILGIATALLVSGDITWTIGISSFAVLVYYAIANLAAFRQLPSKQPAGRLLALLGAALCLAVGFFVPVESLLVATVTLAVAMGLRAGLIMRRHSS
jgi:basic amino acid/polyamine antiporter, APA family